MQGLFAHRHPDREGFLARIQADLGPMTYLMHPWAPQSPVGRDARGVALLPKDVTHIAALPDTRAQAPRRTWLSTELLIDGDDVVDRGGELRVPLADVFSLPIFVAGVRSFELLPEADHSNRVEIGKVVIQREGWSVPVVELPERPEDVAAFARDRGMPRRVFIKTPLERKPMYLDTASPVLSRVLCRHVRQAAEDDPKARIRFSEMLPPPEDCWLADPEDNRYVSELRLAAVDQTRRAG